MKGRKTFYLSWPFYYYWHVQPATVPLRHVTEHLSQAEGLIWAAPDSALHILESISTSRHLTGKEQADYALLLSLAQYRCYIPVSSDSLINLAIEYYKDKNDADKKGAAFYVKGCILEEYTKDIPNALLAYKEAEMCIPDMNEKRYVARIYSSLGYINKNLSISTRLKNIIKKPCRQI